MTTKKHFRLAGVPLVLAAIAAPAVFSPGCDGHAGHAAARGPRPPTIPPAGEFAGAFIN